jgi:GABA(A) receptor-associated protein
MTSYRKTKDLAVRKQESKQLREKYPERVPIIVERFAGTSLEELERKKFLVPKELLIGQFIYIIRNRIKLTPEQAIFLFINRTGKSEIIPPSNTILSTIYEEHKDEDGFLYLTYSGENTFG